MDALTLKIDGLSSLVRQLGNEIAQMSSAVEAHMAALEIQSRDFLTMSEAVNTLIAEITKEPEEGENLGELLRQIHQLCTMIYAKLPNNARNS